MVDERRHEDRDDVVVEEDERADEVDETLVNRVAERLNGHFPTRDEFEGHRQRGMRRHNEVVERLNANDNWRENWAQPHIEEAVNFAREGFQQEVRDRILAATEVITETIQEGDNKVDRESRERDDEIRGIATEAKEAADKSARFLSWDLWKLPIIVAAGILAVFVVLAVILTVTDFGLVMSTVNWLWIMPVFGFFVAILVGVLVFIGIQLDNRNNE